MGISFSVEVKKFLKSKISFITLLALLFIPFMGGFFMFVLKDPALAKKIGALSAKAQLAGTADWSSFFGLLTQAISIGGLLIFGFVTSWIFGREYSDRTIKDLLALPTSRNVIVLSKFLVIFLWCFILSLFVFILGLIVGNVVGMPGWTTELLTKGLFKFISCTLLTILLSTPVAFFASIGRGYLSPLGFVVFTLVMSQVIGVVGYGPYFPWAVPALLSEVTGSSNSLGFISFTIVIITSLAGLLGTLCWWRYADQN